LQEKISENLESLSKPKASLFKWGTKATIAYNKISLNPRSREDAVFFWGFFMWIAIVFLFIKYKIAEKLLLNKIKRTLGLHKTRIIAVGAAPFNKQTAEFFMSLGMRIVEAYGMSENCGCVINCLPDKYRFGSAGFLNGFNKIKVYKPDETGNGEICMYGRNMFMGYLNSLAKTQEMFDADGYLHSGDIGKIDEDGFLFITGRIKELIITAGGENVAPIPIEDAVKEELPGIVSNSMVVGDKRKYLTLLITLKVSFSFSGSSSKNLQELRNFYRYNNEVVSRNKFFYYIPEHLLHFH
jgi:long-subunit acyl-CoA synthetase (AMP-forming)